MKIIHQIVVVCLLLILASCSNNKDNSTERAYTMSLAAGDYQTATQMLTHWVNQDSSIQSWAYDSLAYFHFFHNGLVGGQTVRNTKTPMYYVDLGLNLNPKNTFLREIKSKLYLEQGKDTACMVIFQELWNETKDPTFWWDMCFVEMARGNINTCDSMVTLALKDSTLEQGKVRMEHIQAHIQENVPAKAAFVYLQALMLNAIGDILSSANALQEALKIDPNFFAAKQSISDLQRIAAQRQGR